MAQGAKIVMLGREVYSYDASRMIAYAVDLPVAGQIVRASRSEPFLALKLELDPYKIAELSLKVFPHGVPNPQESRGVFVGQATTAIVDAAVRLVELIAQPGDAELLAPLVVDEILIRLLRSSIGPRVAQIGQKESGGQRGAPGGLPECVAVQSRVHPLVRKRAHEGRRKTSSGRRRGGRSRALASPLSA